MADSKTVRVRINLGGWRGLPRGHVLDLEDTDQIRAMIGNGKLVAVDDIPAVQKPRRGDDTSAPAVPADEVEAAQVDEAETDDDKSSKGSRRSKASSGD